MSDTIEYMKICFLTNNYSFVGGLERVLSLVTNGISNKIETHFISMYEIGDNPYKYNKNVKITVLNKDQKKNYFKHIPPSIKKIKEYIKNNDIDYLIYVGEFLSPLAYFACKNSKTKIICWMHAPANNFDEAKVQRFLKWFSMKKAYYTIVLTDESKKILENKYHKSNIYVIPNPVDNVLITDINYNESSKKIISVGRICYAKYYEKLLDVAKLVLPKLPGWTWDIYGDGDHDIKERLEKGIKDYSLKGLLNLKGNSNDIYNIYQNYSFLVLTSRYEGFPMILLEGMSKGLPLVSFDISTGPKEIIENNVNGFLVKPFNEVEMSNKIIELANNNNLRCNMSKNNIIKRNDFNIDKIIDRWIYVLDNINRI